MNQENLLKNKKYFIDQINSSKAYQFICMYHYSHSGFKGAKLNLGIFDINTCKLVGVLQWGRAATAKIRLDRYVKEDITLDEYLELNRFAMADSEGQNSESQAISLGLKWIKKNLPNIRLLVSYSGRIEGNYGYIYQATNWEYLGYFISKAFWRIDGKEFHNTTISLKYKNLNKDKNKNLVDFLCDNYHNVAQYDSKQFIYIIRIDKSLTPATEIKPYPKPATEYPIQTSIIQHQFDKNFVEPDYTPEIKAFYYNPNEKLFTSACLKRHNESTMSVNKMALIRLNLQKSHRILRQPRIKKQLVVYNKDGIFESIWDSVSSFLDNNHKYRETALRDSMKENKRYKDKYFKLIVYGTEYPKEIPVNVLCWIDGQPFYKQKEIVEYMGVAKQTVSACVKRRGKTIKGKTIIWNESQD